MARLDRAISSNTMNRVMARSRPRLSGLIPCWRQGFFNVMAGLVPAIHVFTGGTKDVDGRHTGGHDEVKSPSSTVPGVQPERTGQSWARPGHPHLYWRHQRRGWPPDGWP